MGQGAKVRCFPSTDDIVLNTLHCTIVHACDDRHIYFTDTRVMTKGFKRWLGEKPSRADYLCKSSIAHAIELYAMAYYARLAKEPYPIAITC